jgi:hypothetical protein
VAGLLVLGQDPLLVGRGERRRFGLPPVLTRPSCPAIAAWSASVIVTVVLIPSHPGCTVVVLDHVSHTSLAARGSPEAPLRLQAGVMARDRPSGRTSGSPEAPLRQDLPGLDPQVGGRVALPVRRSLHCGAHAASAGVVALILTPRVCRRLHRGLADWELARPSTRSAVRLPDQPIVDRGFLCVA